MAKYDSVGFENVMPGTNPVTHGDSYTQGTNGAVKDPGSQLGMVVATRPFDSVQEPATMQTASQGYGSTAPGSNDPNYERISGITTPTSVTGNVVTPHHPNAST